MKQLISETAEKLGMEEETVSTVINFFFRSFYKVITKVRLKELDTLYGVKTNAVIPGFGKLVVTQKRKQQLEKRKHGSTKSM